jgi:DNA-directed RNA polymerase sigma subunit (sigma70/sigma32)
MGKKQVEWAKAPTFHEAAEALGVPTDQIAAMMEDGGRMGVLWSPVRDGEDAAYTTLARDEDGIVRVNQTARRDLPGYWPALFERLNNER